MKKEETTNLWQSLIWKKFQEKLCKKTYFLQSNQGSLLAIQNKLPFGYSWLDIPRGPTGKVSCFQKLI